MKRTAILLALPLLFLTACMEDELTLVLEEDGSGTAEIYRAWSPEMIKPLADMEMQFSGMMGEMAGAMTEGMEDMTREMANGMAEATGAGGATIPSETSQWAQQMTAGGAFSSTTTNIQGVPMFKEGENLFSVEQKQLRARLESDAGITVNSLETGRQKNGWPFARTKLKFTSLKALSESTLFTENEMSLTLNDNGNYVLKVGSEDNQMGEGDEAGAGMMGMMGDQFKGFRLDYDFQLPTAIIQTTGETNDNNRVTWLADETKDGEAFFQKLQKIGTPTVTFEKGNMDLETFEPEPEPEFQSSSDFGSWNEPAEIPEGIFQSLPQELVVKIRGKAIESPQITVQNGILEFGEPGFSSDYSAMLFLFDDDDNLSGDAYVVEPDTRSGPHVHLRYPINTETGQDMGSDVTMLMATTDDFMLYLQFGMADGNTIPGQIIFKYNGDIQAEIRGPFTAEMK